MLDEYDGPNCQVLGSSVRESGGVIVSKLEYAELGATYPAQSQSQMALVRNLHMGFAFACSRCQRGLRTMMQLPSPLDGLRDTVFLKRLFVEIIGNV